MSATPYLKLADLVENLQFQCEISPDLSELQGVIHDYQVTHFDLLDLDITTAENNAILKTLTGCVVATGSDLNCYPVGLETQTCFDLDGNVVP